MKIRTVKIWLSKGWYYTVYSVSLLLIPLFLNIGKAAAANPPFQQESNQTYIVKKGDVVTGTVKTKDGQPIPKLTIVERKINGKAKRSTLTNEKGEFSLKVVNPSDLIDIQYQDHFPQQLDIDRKHYDIIMYRRNDSTVRDSLLPLMVDRFLVGRTAIYGPPAVRKKSKVKTQKDSTIITFDYRDPNSNLDPTRMRLMYGVQIPQDSKPLLVVDGTPWPMDRVDKDILSKFDFDKDIYSRKKVAALLGFKRKELKAARMLKDQEAQRIWGRMGVNGVFEVVTTEAYYDITHLTPKSSADDYQLLK